MLVAKRSKFDALLRMSIFAVLTAGLTYGFNDQTFVYWFCARITTTLLAGFTIARFQESPSVNRFISVFVAYALDALPFFWLVAYFWLSFNPDYQVIAILMLAAGFIYSLTHRLRVPSLGLIYVVGIQLSFTLIWTTLLIKATASSDVALAITVMGLQAYHALTMRETFSTLATIDRSARRSEATRRLEAIGRVTGGVAHAFNNNLAAIVCGVDPVRSRTTDTETARNLDLALRAANEAGTDVGRLLAYTRQFPLRPETCDLKEVLDRLQQEITASGLAGLEVTSDIATGFPKLFVDRTQLATALLELVKNSAAAGATRVSFRASRSSDLNLRAEIAVEDNGSGVPPNVIEQIFEPFFSEPASPTRPGLGLSMVRGFIEQSGGRVSLGASDTGGTIVLIALPIKRIDTNNT